MSSKKPSIFLLDANVFIQAHRSYYAFDICPGFWRCLIHYFKLGKLLSIDRVRSEMVDKKGDILEKWVKEKIPKDMFVSTKKDVEVGNAYREMINWIESKNYKAEVVSKFSDSADGWLVAYAMAHDVELVTTEVYNKEAKNRIPIPNICEQFNVRYRDSFSMLRSLGIEFRWDTMGMEK